MKDKWELKNLSITKFYPQAKKLGLETESGIYLYILLCCLNIEYINNENFNTEIKEYFEEFKKINFFKNKIEKYNLLYKKVETKEN